MKAFSLISTMLMTLLFSGIGSVIVVTSLGGSELLKSNIKINISEVNANYALEEALNDVMENGNCNGVKNGELNGGKWSYVLHSINNHCFVLAKGEKDNAKRYKVAYVNFGGGGGLGALTINYLNGEKFILKGSSKISNNGENCPAIVYHKKHANIEYEGSAKIEGNIVELSDPLNIPSLLFKENMTETDIKNYFKDIYDSAINNVLLPSEPNYDCQIDAGSGICKLQNMEISCQNRSLSLENCSGLLIRGEKVSITVNNANILNIPLIIEVNELESFTTGGNTEVGDIYIKVTEFGKLVAEGSTKINGNLVIKADKFIKYKDDEGNIILSGNTTISEGIYIMPNNGNISSSGEKIKVKLSGSSAIGGDFYFLGYGIDLNYTGGNNTGSSGIEGNIYIKSYKKYEIDMKNYGEFVKGSIYANCVSSECEGEVEIKNGELSQGQGKEFIFLSNGKELEVELEHGSGSLEGYFINLSDDGKVSIEIESGGFEVKGVFIGNKIEFEEEKEFAGSNKIAGILIGNIIEGLELGGSARIDGLIAALNNMEKLKLSGSSAINGIVVGNILEGSINLDGSSNITLDLDIVNSLISEFDLNDYLKNLVCEGNSSSGSLSFPQHLIGSIY